MFDTNFTRFPDEEKFGDPSAGNPNDILTRGTK
jgi:hypothetical protein